MLMTKSNNHTLNTARMVWIDWMKAIGMYLIVLGHFFAIGHKFVYVFSVPIFFVISGFLSKREANQKEFWKKIFALTNLKAKKFKPL